MLPAISRKHICTTHPPLRNHYQPALNMLHYISMIGHYDESVQVIMRAGLEVASAGAILPKVRDLRERLSVSWHEVQGLYTDYN